MTDTALKLTGVSRRFGGLVAVNSVDLHVGPGERHVLIGPNGAGKTTLFNCITGVLPLSSGRIELFGEDITEQPERIRAARGMARTFQVSNVFADLTVAENLTLAIFGRDGRKWRMARAFTSLGGVREQVEELLETVRLSERVKDPVNLLSYGERKQLDLALALAMKPRVLFLDEPCAGLAPSDRQRLSQILDELPADITMVMIEHDMDIALRVARRVTVLHYGKVIFEGAPADVVSDKEVREVYFGTA